MDKIFCYHIITSELNFEHNLKPINAYPVVPPKHVLENNGAVANVDRRGFEKSTERTETIDEPGYSGTRFDAGADNGRSGESYFGEETKISTEEGWHDGVQDDTEIRIREFCKKNGIVGIDYECDGYTATFGRGITRRYDERGGGLEGYGGENFGQVVKMEQIGEYGRRPKIASGLHKSPWKCAMFHFGTKKPHWHFLYISRSKQWGHNSAIGRAIRATPYKCQSVRCLPCIHQYFYSSDGRQVVQDILSPGDYETAICAIHQMRVESGNARERENLLSECEEGGAPILTVESDAPGMGVDVVVHANDEGSSGFDQQGNTVHVRSRNNNINRKRRADSGTGQIEAGNDISKNENLVLLLVKKRAFNEARAQRILSREVSGITFLFGVRAAEKLRTAVTVSRILVFQETPGMRFERAKHYDKEMNANADDAELIKISIEKLEKLLRDNEIDAKKFATDTKNHYYRLTGKKNNLFFFGPPDCGKTAVAESLADCHYNTARLTGLNSSSTFNFASLIHVNAVFMDECKMTVNQFEQWKLLAGGSPMSTDVKHRDKQDVEHCVLYTSSNYPIEMYVDAPDARKAVETRTIQYNFNKHLPEKFMLNTFTWEALWSKYC